MSSSGNQGIIGQTVNISGQNVAVGANSQVEQSVSVERADAPLEALRQAIEALDTSPTTRQALLTSHAEIAAELEAPTLDRNKLLTKLASLKEAAGSGAAIAQAVAALTQVIAVLC